MASVIRWLFLLSAFVGEGFCGCTENDWTTSFDTEGLSMCSLRTQYLTSFYRSAVVNRADDPIKYLDKGKCCDVASRWLDSLPQVVTSNWRGSFKQNNGWNSCPEGFFLAGLFRISGDKGGLTSIEEGRCIKPGAAPRRYQSCYDEDINTKFETAGWVGCSKPNFFITGLYRGNCNHLLCLDKLRCCDMVISENPPDEMHKLQTFIMDTTQVGLANLAHTLGYGWCSGCRDPYVGEGFVRRGDSWEAEYVQPCVGFMNDKRLKIVYGNWSFGIKEIKYGDSVIEELTPETADSGSLDNDGAEEAVKSVSREENIIRSVTHITGTDFKYSVQLGIEINYSPPPTGGFGGSASFGFGYEKSTKTETKEGNQDYKLFKVKVDVKVPARSKVKWNMMVAKTRRTVPYTAVVIAKFSVEFQGFLRWGQGKYGVNTNYHNVHRGSDKRPFFNYRFGDSKTSFYEALKRQSQNNELPWLWNDMKNAHNEAQATINDLVRESKYVLILKGKFEDVIGKSVDMKIEGKQPVSSSSLEVPHSPGKASGPSLVAKVGPNDKPSPNPAQPVVGLVPSDLEPKLKSVPTVRE